MCGRQPQYLHIQTDIEEDNRILSAYLNKLSKVKKITGSILCEELEPIKCMIIVKKALLKPANNTDPFTAYYDDRFNWYLLSTKILEYINDHISEIKFNAMHNNYIDEILQPIASSELNDLRVYALANLLKILNLVFIQSINVRRFFSETKFLRALLAFLDENKLKLMQEARELISLIIVNIGTLSLIANENQTLWSELNCFDILLKLIKNNSLISKFHEHAIYTIISSVFTDKQLESLEMSNYVIENARILEIVAADFKKESKLRKKPIKRMKQDFVDLNNNIINYMVYKLIYKNMGFEGNVDDWFKPLTVVLETLYNFSINDSLKKTIFDKIYDSLKTIILRGNEIEQRYSISLLAQLCFNSDTSSNVSKDSEIFNKLTELSNSSELTFKTLQIKSQELIFLIEKLSHTNIKQESSILNKNKHIMISYNSTSRDLCMKIKKNLEKANYKVWIDVENIHGSSLNSMAQAVEESWCVLVCVTEKYRQSVFCRAEAQYTFKLEKPFVPLIMEKNYGSVGGWLGLVIGDKIFVDYIKHSFDESMRRLIFELEKIQQHINITSSPLLKNTSAPTPGPPQTIPEIKKQPNEMSELEIENWFNENNLNLKLFASLKPCNGATLEQLYLMRKDAPEFYFQTIKEILKNDISSLLSFSDKLNTLFIK